MIVFSSFLNNKENNSLTYEGLTHVKLITKSILKIIFDDFFFYSEDLFSPHYNFVEKKTRQVKLTQISLQKLYKFKVLAKYLFASVYQIYKTDCK